MGTASPSGDAEFTGDAPVSAGEIAVDAAPAGNAKWPIRIALVAGVLIAIGAVVTAVLVASGPRADATLPQTGEDASLDVLLLLVATEPHFEVDGATLEQHESFEGWDILSGFNDYGSPCLVAIAPTDEWVRIECTPAPAQLVADTHPFTQPDGPMIRFILDGDTVEAWVYPHAKAQ